MFIFSEFSNFLNSLLNCANIVVCDEGHAMKNSTTILHKTVCKLKTKRRIILSGTPIQNNLLECKYIYFMIEFHMKFEYFILFLSIFIICLDFNMIQFIRRGFLGNLRSFTQLFITIIQNGMKPKAVEYEKSTMRERSYILFKQSEPIVHVIICNFTFECLFFNLQCNFLFLYSITIPIA